MSPIDFIIATLAKDIFFIITRSAQYLFRFVRAVVVEVSKDPFDYGVVVLLVVTCALWGLFCLRFVPEDEPSEPSCRKRLERP